MDTFIPVRGGRGYVRHYLIDFGDSLGAAGDRQKYVGEGYAYLFDWREIFKSLFAGGLYYPEYLRLHRSPYRAVGNFEARLFRPAGWRSQFANPAFDEADAGDDFWAAALIARFRRPLVEAAVATAKYRERGAARYVVDTLMRRRARILRWVFADMAALDRPVVTRRYRVTLDDLAVIGDLRSGPQRFRWSVRWNRTRRRDRVIASGTTTGAQFDLQMPLRKVMLAHQHAFVAEPYLTLRVQRLRGSRPGPAIEVHLRAAYDFLIPIGVDREP
jgi:hypothetical protein